MATQKWNGVVPTIKMDSAISILEIIFVPWRTSYQPIKSLLNAEKESRDIQTRAWRDRKLNELTFVGITCAVMTGVVVQAISWPQAQTGPKIAMGFWYSSLLLSISAVCLATQQSLVLNRISCYKDSARRTRSLIGKSQTSKDNDSGETWVPRKSQLYVWQTPIMCLNFGILAFVFGLGIIIASQAMEGQALSLIAVVSIFIAINYFLCTGFLYHCIHSIE